MAAFLPRIRVNEMHNEPAGTSHEAPVVAGPYRREVGTGDQATTGGASPASEYHMRQVSDSNTNETIIAPSNRNTLQTVADDERPMSARSLDPLSEQILKRTGNMATIAPGHATTERSPKLSGLTLTGETQDVKPSVDSGLGDGQGRPQKEKAKGAAFLARFRANKKKEQPPEESVNAEALDKRPEGAEAEEFFQPVDNLGFSPRHPQPPPYIKVRGKYKKEREFNRLFLSQHLRDETASPLEREASTSGKLSKKPPSSKNGNAVYGLEVSKDGKYLASTGEDKCVRVWSLISSSDDRRSFESAENSSMRAPGHTHLSAPVFRSEPIRVYAGHEGAVLDLSWSKNNFLLSSSMDKTVRLWHVSRNECLCAFKHSDFVTSIQFHPKDDRFFLAGSLDSKLRLWSIPDKRVAYTASLPDMITAVAFTPDGKQSVAGCLSGVCLFYETENLRYQTQIHVKSRTGKNAKGSKITGIQTIDLRPGKGSSDVKLLITSNDSRIRLYNLRDKSLEMKFKGHENSYSQNHARFSDDARHIICGSEDKKVYIWSTTPSDLEKKDKWPVEVFEAHSADTTVSLLAPTRTRLLLGASEDPIYDSCNPPPVHLVSRSEAAAESASLPGDASSAHRHPSASTDGLNINRRPSNSPPTNSPAYIARSGHPNGNIIITASASGDIRIFRQDCAWEKRAAHSFSDAASSSHIKRTGSTLLHRSSLATSQRSRHSSNNLTRQDSSASASTQHPRDRILSWRQSIGAGSTHSLDKASPAFSTFSFANTPNTSSPALARNGNANGNAGRSASPRKSLSTTRRGRFSRQSSAAGTPVLCASESPSEQSPGPTAPGTTPTTLARAQSHGVSITSAPTQRPAEPTRNDTSTSTYWQRDAWRDGIREQILAPPRVLDGASDVNSRSQSYSRSPDPDPDASAVGTPSIAVTGTDSHGSGEVRTRTSESRSRSPHKRVAGLRLPGSFRGSMDGSPGGSPERVVKSTGGLGLGFGARLTNVLSSWSALTDGRSEGANSEEEIVDGDEENKRKEKEQVKSGAREETNV